MAIFSRKEAPCVVSIPSPKEDRALSGKVGIEEIAGFALVVAWPRLVGSQVGPDTPGGGSGVTPPMATSAKNGAASASGAAEPAEASSAGDVENPEDASSPTNRQTVVVSDGKVDGCKKRGD